MQDGVEMKSRLGVVVIGRNEGERLKSCLSQLAKLEYFTVYVDSGSTDNSVELASDLGAEVVELDMRIPFSAARARNEGFNRITSLVPNLSFVQFLDGDCTLDDNWLSSASEFLSTRRDIAVVCGRLVERFPDASIYNRLASLEWSMISGEIKACGGCAMYRTNIFRNVGGFNPTVLAAEDDEICLRIRRQNEKIFFLDAPMADHDTAMFHFHQWWRRATRTGYAYAQGAQMHGKQGERHFVQQLRSTFLWGAFIPLVTALTIPITFGLSSVLLTIYLVLLIRIYRKSTARGWSKSDAMIYSLFVVLAKFPQLVGVLKYHFRQILGLRKTIIEYKKVDE